MKKSVSVILLAAAFALVGLTGCNDLTTPENALGSAYSDIQSGSLSAFKETLVHNALAQYGTAEGLALLSQQLKGQEITVGPRKLVWSDDSSPKTKRYVYSLDVIARNKATNQYSHFKTATVFCLYERDQRPLNGHVPDYSPQDTTTCQICDLR